MAATQSTTITQGATVEFVRAAQLGNNTRDVIKAGTQCRVIAVEDNGALVRFLVLNDKRNRAGLVRASWVRVVSTPTCDFGHCTRRAVARWGHPSEMRALCADHGAFVQSHPSVYGCERAAL